MEASPNWVTSPKIPPLLKLTPGQREDYERTTSFCVRGSNRQLYRIDARTKDLVTHLYRVIDDRGWRRGFWFVTRDYSETWHGTLEVDDMVLALMVFLQVKADVFEMEACVGGRAFEAGFRSSYGTTDYRGEI
jgi:hypothetical protein